MVLRTGGSLTALTPGLDQARAANKTSKPSRWPASDVAAASSAAWPGTAFRSLGSSDLLAEVPGGTTLSGASIQVRVLSSRIALRRSDHLQRTDIDWRAASWIWPWLIGMTIIGLIGRYGKGAEDVLPEWIDLIVVAAFSLVIFYYAVSIAMQPEAVKSALET